MIGKCGRRLHVQKKIPMKSLLYNSTNPIVRNIVKYLNETA